MTLFYRPPNYKGFTAQYVQCSFSRMAIFVYICLLRQFLNSSHYSIAFENANKTHSSFIKTENEMLQVFTCHTLHHRSCMKLKMCIHVNDSRGSWMWPFQCVSIKTLKFKEKARRIACLWLDILLSPRNSITMYS